MTVFGQGTKLYRYRDLLWLWTVREIRVRYKQSLLGFAWAIVQPLSLTIVFTFVFSRIIRMDTGDIPYPVFAYTALLPWTFFSTALSFGVPSLINNMGLVTKIYFPREILPLANIGAALVDFVVASLIFAGILVVYRQPLTIQALWIFPLLGVQLLLMVGVTLLGSSLLVFYRDVRFVIPLLVQVWMYASPVIYPIDWVPESLRPYYDLNPMAGLIDGYRRVLLLGEPPRGQAMLFSVALSAILFLLSYVVFKHLEPLFADVI